MRVSTPVRVSQSSSNVGRADGGHESGASVRLLGLGGERGRSSVSQPGSNSARKMVAAVREIQVVTPGSLNNGRRFYPGLADPVLLVTGSPPDRSAAGGVACATI